MRLSHLLKNEIERPESGIYLPNHYRVCGYDAVKGEDLSDPMRRAKAIYALFTLPKPHIYKNDLIAGSLLPLFANVDGSRKEYVARTMEDHPERGFSTNSDHFTPDYDSAMRLGLTGLTNKIAESKAAHADDPEKLDFLSAMELTLKGAIDRLSKTAEAARALIGAEGYDPKRLTFIAENCEALSARAPESFPEALQLLWMLHSCFLYEGRFAMAIGRIDQYLYPFYKSDLEKGTITREFATELVENAFMKIYERRIFVGADDTVNICIGGSNARGESDENELSFIVLDAVRGCNIPGPNLSARIAFVTSDKFLDECLKVIGTGIGYPALMNDEVNVEALSRYGYDINDVYNYTMVGCIENFITGMQPPWSDARFDVPRFFEYIFNMGKSFAGDSRGVNTGSVRTIDSMEEFMNRFRAQLRLGVKEYVDLFLKRNVVYDPSKMTAPFLSCFCRDCIGRGLDINMGGAVYPSVHGAALMGVGTVSDSLAAIEKTVFIDKSLTLDQIREALLADFVGYEDVRQTLLDAPKYGNNDDLADKYAVEFVDFFSDEFLKYKTPDGGGIYLIMAANTSNIHAGAKIGATPDGRHAGEPLSDAASPTYGRDRGGATTTVLSVTKPDYRKVACGTVINQKFSPSMFKDGNRQKLLALIRVYFSRGGQEMQINSTSPEVLIDAMEHPENHGDLVVRVSGFSAYYVTLDRRVQKDILARTQQDF